MKLKVSKQQPGGVILKSHRGAMASAAYSEDLTCPVCRTFFTDPVTLLCGHSLCRECIASPQCPQCPQTAVPTEEGCLPTNIILQRLAEKIKTENGRESAPAELCPEHDEKLKLFCVTDQQLACIICRDGERHNGHKFKPIKEAAASLRQQLEEGVEGLRGDIVATESLAHAQRAEMAKTKEKARQLETQIRRQFEEMHQFLRKREDEVKNELRHKEEDAVGRMRDSLGAMETALSESRDVEAELTSVLQIEDSEGLLRSWSQGNSRKAPECLFRQKANNLQVVDTSLSMGPYESHLQFFVWKEMLQVIQPRAELLSLKSHSADIAVSDDGRSLFCIPRSEQATSGFKFGPPKGSGQNTGLNFGTPTGSGQNTGLNFGTSAGSSFGFGTSTRSGQNTAFGFGTPKGSCQNTGLNFGTPKGSCQNTGLNFGTPAGSGQTAASSLIHHVFSVNTFTSGQHYWETEVGHRDYWELGIKDNFLKYDGQKYSTCSPKKTTELAPGARPRKIGIYLNCVSKKLSFYNADNMTHIHTMCSGPMTTPVSAYFTIRVRTPDPNPLTVCWY
ncbi:nuclear factor 7, brain-like [Anoplopoma fimbria]|uniref:nuclear factor 7, brain-like n=1 Tax=Anoplopoma fimbria TaxID=229290 RepID=UPI0023EC167F|nr:nuclear factor 7, brain-like [Anoplopoma fimbria]